MDPLVPSKSSDDLNPSQPHERQQASISQLSHVQIPGPWIQIIIDYCYYKQLSFLGEGDYAEIDN